MKKTVMIGLSLWLLSGCMATMQHDNAGGQRESHMKRCHSPGHDHNPRIDHSRACIERGKSSD